MSKTYQQSFSDIKTAGFTLIELLVVVLIIGILSAVALPQYERAVMKTRVMSLMPMLRAINDAQQRYYMANGTYTISFDDLDISLPSGATIYRTADREVFSYENWECLLRYSAADDMNTYSAYCNSKQSGSPKLEKYYSKDYFVCWAAPVGSKAYRLCQAISNRQEPTSTGSAGFGFAFK